MLTLAAAEALMARGQLRVAYYCIGTGTDARPCEDGQEWVDLVQARPTTKQFRQNYFGTRLHVTLGPLVKSLDRRYWRKRRSFKKHPDVFDIRQSQNRLTLYPRETLLIKTNERIVFGDGVAALVMPRLKLVDSGVLYTPSYVDPGWDGVLQAVITNSTDERHVIDLGEPVANCFLFQAEPAVPDLAALGFAAKSHHFGQNWPRLLTSPEDPFPRQKLPEDVGMFRALGDRAGRLGRWALGAVGATAVLGALWKAAPHGAKLAHAVSRFESLETDVTNVGKANEDLSTGRPRAGTVFVDVPPGARRASVTVAVRRPSQRAGTVWAQPLPESHDVLDSVSGEVHGDPKDPEFSQVTLDLKVKPSEESTRVGIRWLLVSE